MLPCNYMDVNKYINFVTANVACKRKPANTSLALVPRETMHTLLIKVCIIQVLQFFRPMHAFGQIINFLAKGCVCTFFARNRYTVCIPSCNFLQLYYCVVGVCALRWQMYGSHPCGRKWREVDDKLVFKHFGLFFVFDRRCWIFVDRDWFAMSKGKYMCWFRVSLFAIL